MTGRCHRSEHVDIIEENGKHSIMIVMRCVISLCTHEQYQQLSTLQALSPHQRADYANGQLPGRHERGPGALEPTTASQRTGGAKTEIGPRTSLPLTRFPENHLGTCRDFSQEPSRGF